MITLIYAGTAIGFLLLVLVLLARTRPEEPGEHRAQKDFAQCLGDARWLDLSERIFDPSDARWLCEELAFPKLAISLTRARKQLAIRWLKALQASFAELVRRPEPEPGEAPPTNSAASWQMLWLTVRIQVLLLYALLMVRLFGPYHRLIPSFTWIPSPQRSASRIRSVLADNTDLG
jgi:hypothetical protein